MCHFERYVLLTLLVQEKSQVYTIISDLPGFLLKADVLQSLYTLVLYSNSC